LIAEISNFVRDDSWSQRWGEGKKLKPKKQLTFPPRKKLDAHKIRETPRFSTTNAERQDYRRDCRYVNRFALLKADKHTEWIRWKNITHIARKPDTVWRNARRYMNAPRKCKDANKVQTIIRNRRRTLLS